MHITTIFFNTFEHDPFQDPFPNLSEFDQDHFTAAPSISTLQMRGISFGNNISQEALGAPQFLTRFLHQPTELEK